MTVETRKSLKEMALVRFENFDSWLREPSTIFNNGNQEVWIKNEDGFCTMRAMQNHKWLMGRKYSNTLVIGFYDLGVKNWVTSPHLEAKYPVWVQETKRLLGINGGVVR